MQPFPCSHLRLDSIIYHITVQVYTPNSLRLFPQYFS
nr:MAG TPA: hypothetical protein [Caudoviricetes sp.]